MSFIYTIQFLDKINLKEFWIEQNKTLANKKITDEEWNKLKNRKLNMEEIRKIKLDRITDEELLNWQSQLKVTNVVSLNEYLEQGSEPVMDAHKNSHFQQPEEKVQEDELKKMLWYLHHTTFRNEKQIQNSKQCGCFHCGRIFPAETVTEWCDESENEDFPPDEEEIAIREIIDAENYTSLMSYRETQKQIIEECKKRGTYNRAKKKK